MDIQLSARALSDGDVHIDDEENVVIVIEDVARFQGMPEALANGDYWFSVDVWENGAWQSDSGYFTSPEGCLEAIVEFLAPKGYFVELI